MTGNAQLRELPGVDRVLAFAEVAGLIDRYGRMAVVYAVRASLAAARSRILAGESAPTRELLCERIRARVLAICDPLRPIVNATGIVLHTNLGRAPLGREVVGEIARLGAGYCNLEYDLDRARRGSRGTHLRELLKVLTGAEDALVVNNNAAAIILALHVLARGREVVVSRGELIEIGGSFRLQEVMAASGARTVEIGATNRTHSSDYEQAIHEETALLMKAHKSNYVVRGFAAEVGVEELAGIAHAKGLPLLYDMGSGMLRALEGSVLAGEPDVRHALEAGADLVTFSGDKLVGGPQCGIVVGKADLIARMARAPLMRALRVGKLTIIALWAACRRYLAEDGEAALNPAFEFLARTPGELEKLADRLLAALAERGIEGRVVESGGQCGGGALPGRRLPSRAVELSAPPAFAAGDLTFAEATFRRLLQGDAPVLAVLREGRLLLDVLAVRDDEIGAIVDALAGAVESSGAGDGDS